MESVRLYTDGGARGNPGPAGAGGWLEDPQTGVTIASFAQYLGERTNNQAEYAALITGLELAQQHGARRVEGFLDSELLVEQMSGRYKVKNAGLRDLHARAQALAAVFNHVRFQHIPRAHNRRADQLVNQAIDQALSA